MKVSYKMAMMVPAVSLIMSSCVGGMFKNEIISLGKDYVLLEDIYTHEDRLVVLPYKYSKNDPMPDILPYLHKGDTIDFCIISDEDDPSKLYVQNLQFNHGIWAIYNESGAYCYITIDKDTINNRKIRKRKQDQQKHIQHFKDSINNQRQR